MIYGIYFLKIQGSKFRFSDRIFKTAGVKVLPFGYAELAVQAACPCPVYFASLNAPVFHVHPTGTEINCFSSGGGDNGRNSGYSTLKYKP
jgi:hypothetical protein